MTAVIVCAACNGGRPNIGLDETPAELTFANEVPLYTREASVTVSVRAMDPSGVASVWCEVGKTSAIEAKKVEDGAYSCGITLEPEASNAVKIWAVDLANNSGQGRDPPYMLTQTIVQSENALAVSLNGAAPATYYDESSMTVGTAVPPVYGHEGIGLEVVRSGETIHKASTRLASSTLKTASDLEGANPDNLPWLQFVVSLTGSPVAAATYKIEAKAGSTTKEYSGDLLPEWLSPQSDAGATSGDVYLDLPLDSQRIPLLTTAVGAVELKVAVDVADAAGNKGGYQVALKYSVIGPPLNFGVDSKYPIFAMPGSTYACKIANGTYHRLFDASDYTTFGPTQQVRLERVIVTNPASQPVALEVSGVTGSWSMTENWIGSAKDAGPTTYNNETCPPDNDHATNHEIMYVRFDGSLLNYDPGAASVGSTSEVGNSSLSSLAERIDKSPVQMVGGRYIVPPAEGSSPGVVSLYVTRPVAARLARAPALERHDEGESARYTNDMGMLYVYASETNSPIGCCMQGFLPTTYYLYRFSFPLMDVSFDRCSLDYLGAFDAYAGQLIGTGTYCGKGPVACPMKDGWLNDNHYGSGMPCSNCTNTCSCSGLAKAQTYNASTYYQQLAAASETFAVTFAPVTQPTDGAANLFGVANVWAAGIAIKGSFTH